MRPGRFSCIVNFDPPPACVQQIIYPIFPPTASPNLLRHYKIKMRMTAGAIIPIFILEHTKRFFQFFRISLLSPLSHCKIKIKYDGISQGTDDDTAPDVLASSPIPSAKIDLPLVDSAFDFCHMTISSLIHRFALAKFFFRTLHIC